jgi:hypothetical protein
MRPPVGTALHETIGTVMWGRIIKATEVPPFFFPLDFHQRNAYI